MLLTNRSPESLSKLGRQLRVKSLISQAHATLKMVAEDQPVAKKLGAVFIGEMKAALERFEASLADRSYAQAIAKMAAVSQDASIDEANAWRREFVNLVAAALVTGVEVPPEAGLLPTLTSPAAIAVEVDRLVEIGEKFSGRLGPVGVTPDLLKQGKVVADAVRAADELQEHLHRKGRSEAVRKVHALAATVYIALKRVNRVAGSVHARDRAKAHDYNLDILRRRAAAKSESPPPDKPAEPQVPAA